MGVNGYRIKNGHFIIFLFRDPWILPSPGRSGAFFLIFAQSLLYFYHSIQKLPFLIDSCMASIMKVKIERDAPIPVVHSAYKFPRKRMEVYNSVFFEAEKGGALVQLFRFCSSVV